MNVSGQHRFELITGENFHIFLGCKTDSGVFGHLLLSGTWAVQLFIQEVV